MPAPRDVDDWPVRLTPIWVVIPANRSYVPHLRECLEVMGSFSDRAVIISNGPHPVTEHETGPVAKILHDPGDINISRWWNRGLDWVEVQESSEHGMLMDEHHVLVLNADARIAPEGIVRLSHELARSQAVMAGPARGNGLYLDERTGPIPIQERAPGYCFMLKGSARLRADERFAWWCGDDDLQYRARYQGGVLHVGPVPFTHLGDGVPKGECLRLAKEDVRKFEELYGTRPW
jgi:hypothetical protein